MSAVTDLAVAVASQVVTGVLPSVLSILGGFLALIVGAWGALQVYSHFTGGSSSDVTYKIGRMFGAEIYEKDYEEYADKRSRREAKRDRDKGFGDRYFFEKYDRGDAVLGKDFY